MVKLLFFRFRVTNSRLKNEENSLQVTNSMGALLFSHFRVTNMKLIYEKNSLNITGLKWHGCVILLRFLYLVCFVVSTYVIFIWVCWILMAYATSTTYLFTKLHKTLSSCEPKEEWPHADLYHYNVWQIEPFHMKWFNGE